MKLFSVTTIVVMALMLFFVAMPMADEVVKEPINVPSLKLPDMQAGMIYSAVKSDFEPCATVTALKYPTKVGDIELRAGYAAESELIGALCFKIGDLTKYGFIQPLHNIINVSGGPYAGYDYEREEWDWGGIITIIQLTF